MPPPRSKLASLAALSLAAACGARSGLEDPPDASAAAVSFPVGEYTDCARGVFSPSGGVMGVDHGATLSLTQSGASLRARYVDQNGARSEYTFAATTAATAVLVPDGVASAGEPHPCVLGVGSVARSPTALVVDVGSLAVDRNAVLIAAEGTATDVTPGPCGTRSDRQGVWIACRRRDRTSPAVTITSSTAAFPTGTFACQTQAATYVLAGAIHQYAGNGAMGSLTIAQRGGALSLSYTGDRAATLAADFALTSNATARLNGPAGLRAVCDVPINTPAATSVAPLNASAGAVLRAGSTLFVSVVGAMEGACAGAEKFVTLRCVPR
ncbi:MAG: hypothetical protein U0324_23205 [Polyangiales bacterium]